MMQYIQEIIKKKYPIIWPFVKRLKYNYLKYCVSDVSQIKKSYLQVLKRNPELIHPIKYNDKIQWLKLNWYDPLAERCADKYEVRSFVEEKIGKEVLNELYGLYTRVEDIDINAFPDSFVLKGTHDSGFNIVCTDKHTFNWNEEFKKMKGWLKTNYYWSAREWVYKDLQPRIICEKFLIEDDGGELRDYRFFCFNGEPKFIAVDFHILDKSKARRNLYDLDWNLMEEEITYPKELATIAKKPAKLNEMVQFSRVLSKNFSHVRIDFYLIQGEIKFGEMTFFHQSGLGRIRPEKFEIQMGDWLKLPAISHKIR